MACFHEKDHHQEVGSPPDDRLNVSFYHIVHLQKFNDECGRRNMLLFSVLLWSISLQMLEMSRAFEPHLFPYSPDDNLLQQVHEQCCYYPPYIIQNM